MNVLSNISHQRAYSNIKSSSFYKGIQKQSHPTTFIHCTVTVEFCSYLSTASIHNKQTYISKVNYINDCLQLLLTRL